MRDERQERLEAGKRVEREIKLAQLGERVLAILTAGQEGRDDISQRLVLCLSYGEASSAAWCLTTGGPFYDAAKSLGLLEEGHGGLGAEGDDDRQGAKRP